MKAQTISGLKYDGEGGQVTNHLAPSIYYRSDETWWSGAKSPYTVIRTLCFLIMHKVANAGIARGVLDTSTEMDVVMPWASARNGAITHKWCSQIIRSLTSLANALDSTAAPEGAQLSDLNLPPGNHPDNDVNKTSRALSAQGRERETDTTRWQTRKPRWRRNVTGREGCDNG